MQRAEPTGSESIPPLPVDTSAAAAELLQLFHGARHAGRNDAAWCIAHAGVQLLGQGTPSEIAAFERQYRRPRPGVVRHPLSESSWLRLVSHPDNDPYIGKAFESVLSSVRQVRCRSLEELGYRRGDAVAAQTSSLAWFRAVRAATEAWRVPLPLVFPKPAHPLDVEHLASEPIALVAGGRVLSGINAHETLFLAGYHMARYRGDLYARVLYPSVTELATLFLATLKLGHSTLAVPDALTDTVEGLGDLLARDPVAEQLVQKVARLFVERSEPVDMARWCTGAEKTAVRAGLLLCGDLPTAHRMLARCPDAPPDAFADLCVFAMSPEYFELRQVTGLAHWLDEESGEVEVIHETDHTASPDALRSYDVPLTELEAVEHSAVVPSAPLPRLLATLVPLVRACIPRTPADFGLGPEAFATSGRLVEAMAVAAARLGIEAPRVALEHGGERVTSRPPCVPVVVVVDPDHLEKLDEAEVAFLAAEHVAFTSEEWILRTWLHDVAWLTDAIEVVGDRSYVSARTHWTIDAALAARDDAAARREAMALWEAFPSASERADAIQAWWRDAESRAARAAFEVAPDADAAERVLAMERGLPSAIPVAVKLRRLGLDLSARAG